MIYDWSANQAGGNVPFGVIPMNFGGGGAGSVTPSGPDMSGIGGSNLSTDTGLNRGVGLSPTTGLQKRIR